MLDASTNFFLRLNVDDFTKLLQFICDDYQEHKHPLFALSVDVFADCNIWFILYQLQFFKYVIYFIRVASSCARSLRNACDSNFQKRFLEELFACEIFSCSVCQLCACTNRSEYSYARNSRTFKCSVCNGRLDNFTNNIYSVSFLLALLSLHNSLQK